MIRIYLFALLMWGSCIYAIVRGGWAERTVAISYLVATILTQLQVSPWAVRFQHVETSILIIDIVLFAILFGVALFSSKFWPLWITAMHGVALLSHFAPFMPAVVPTAYGNAIAIWAWPIMILLAAATWQHDRTRKAMQPLPI